MGKIVRVSIALEDDLLERFDRLRRRRRYGNRSEAIRDLIRGKLVQEQWRADREVVGTITLLYDHHVRELSQELTRMQHAARARVLSTLHVHLDHHHCLEAIVVRGRARHVKDLADLLIGARGVLHGQLSATALARDID